MSHESHEHSSDAVAMPKMQHAFIIVGTQQLFLVHMTNMWVDCHRYQAVFRIDLPADVKRQYLEDRNRNSTDWYMIGNVGTDLMSLPQIKSGGRSSFSGSMWRGMPTTAGTPMWPWANETPVAADFDVTIQDVVYFRRFDFNLDYPATLTYILFGYGDEAHITHYQVKQPEFDHIVTLAEPPRWLPQEGLEAGMPINFPDLPASPGGWDSGQSVYCEDPLRMGTHQVQFSGFGGTWPITLDRTIWFSTNIVNENGGPCAEHSA